MNFLAVLVFTEPGASVWSITSGQDLFLLLLTLFMLVAMLAIGILALNLLFVVQKALDPTPPTPSVVDSRSWWQRIAGLHALSQEKDLMMEHTYDGIAELDNPPPPWFMGLFYGSIAAAVVYMVVFHIIGNGDVMGTEYNEQVSIANIQRAAYIAKIAGGINENTVTQLTDKKAISAGEAIFSQNCVVCHGAKGEGKIGPNLTDAYWLHGGTVKNIFRTLTVGVPEKGMMAWKSKLNPLELQQLASYILSLQGSNPAGAKEPQGEKQPTPIATPGTTGGSVAIQQ